MNPRLLFHVVFVSGAYYLSNALYMVRGLFLARIMGPSVFGVWSAMRLTQTLASFSHMGTRQGLIQLAPHAAGRGDHGEAERLRGAAVGLALLAASIVSLIVLLGAPLAGPWTPEWFVFGAVLFCVQLFFVYHAVAQSLQRFTLTGTGEVVVALVSTALGVLAAWRFGLLGFVSVLGGAYLGGLAAMLRKGPSYPRPRFERHLIRHLLGDGFPIMAASALFTLLWNTDKLLLWIFDTSEALGVYAVQSSFTVVALLAPSALATVLHPHMLERVGAAGTSATLRPYLTSGTALLAACSGPVTAAGNVLLHLPIRWLVPEYVGAIPPGRLLMIATYFSMAATVPMVVVVAASGQRKLCLIRAVAIAAAAVGGLLALGQGFVWLAAAMAVGLILDGLWTLHESLRRMNVEPREARALYVRVAAAFLIMGVSLWLAWSLVPDRPDALGADLAASLLRTVVAVTPGVAWAAWQIRFLRPALMDIPRDADTAEGVMPEEDHR